MLARRSLIHSVNCFLTLMHRLIQRHFWIYCASPAVDSSAHGLDFIEALLAEPVGDGQRTDSVMTDDDDVGVGVELLVGAGGNVAHGNVLCAVDFGSVEFPGLAHVEE
jgi:hypothetical protein